MKPITISKTIFFLLGLGIFFSCSSDDDSGGTGSGQPPLVLTASVTEATTGEEISFEVTANGEAVSNAEIFIDGTSISGYTHVFEDAGDYEAVAKKEGYADSEPIYVNIAEVEQKYDVYVGGHDVHEGETYYRAKYWKNGEPIYLTDGTKYAEASSIFVSNGDVYVAGVESNGSKNIGKYWKNGAPVILTDGTTNYQIRSIYVSNNDVYVVGKDSENAQYWKNGIPTVLPEGDVPLSIFVDNDDVYVAGSGNHKAKYWKNNVPTTLSSHSSTAWSIFVSDGDVYVAGREDNGAEDIALYWKNGTPFYLSDGSYRALARSIFVSDGDVYVAGYEENSSGNKIAKYWKNGVAFELTSSAEAYSIYVIEDNVFVAGTGKNSAGKWAPIYWKNGEAVSLGENTVSIGYAMSIFVTKADE